jgi:hypothetical protein
MTESASEAVTHMLSLVHSIYKLIFSTDVTWTNDVTNYVLPPAHDHGKPQDLSSPLMAHDQA